MPLNDSCKCTTSNVIDSIGNEQMSSFSLLRVCPVPAVMSGAVSPRLFTSPLYSVLFTVIARTLFTK